MLYVHSQMGDAAPGEVDPGALGPAVSSIFERVARDSERLHGPYRVAIGGLPSRMTVGTEAMVRSACSPSRVPPSRTSGLASPEAGWPVCPTASRRTTTASPPES